MIESEQPLLRRLMVVYTARSNGRAIDEVEKQGTLGSALVFNTSRPSSRS